jgi:hypothetical protein
LVIRDWQQKEEGIDAKVREGIFRKKGISM